jgi:hypothetical protein
MTKDNNLFDDNLLSLLTHNIEPKLKLPVFLCVIIAFKFCNYCVIEKYMKSQYNELRTRGMI